jgi:branched-subunit amino acid ABC-type transport system permease component
MTLQGVIIQIICGLSTGMSMFLVTVGLSLIFGTLRILNLAHGAMYMLGAYLCYWISSVVLVEFNGAYWWSLLLAPLILAVIGGLIEIFLLRRIYAREHLAQYLLTFALILVIGELCKLAWGVDFQQVTIPWPLNGAMFFMGMPFPSYNAFLIVCGVITFVGLWTIINHTKLGMIIRAMIHSREMTSALGVNVPFVFTAVFMLGCWLTGLGGALIVPTISASPGMDMVMLIECFVIVVIGGLSSLSGAFLGSLIFGLVNAFGILVAPRLAIAFIFIIMIIVLIVRPWGLMGERES